METQRHESAVAVNAAKGIDVAGLEKELTAMWARATKAGAGAAQPGMMRACVLNLIVYAPAPADRSQIDALLDEVYERNPCRALVLFADLEAGAEKLDAHVSTRCSLSSKGAKQICCEQVTIEAAGRAVERAASAVAPLLVPDVPVFLWWKDIPHYEDRLFERLVEAADRVVIDSAFFDRPHDDLLRLAGIIGANPAHMAVSDLNWGRLTPWRSLVAGFWDVKDYLPHLRKLDRVEINFEPSPRSPGQVCPAALLFAGWLSSRLGWRPQNSRAKTEEGGAGLDLAAGEGRTLRLEFRPAGETGVSASGLRSLALSAREGGAEFCVRMGACGNKLETETKTGAWERAVSRVLSFEEQSEGRRLGGELAILTRDKVYEQAVASCAGLLGAMRR